MAVLVGSTWIVDAIAAARAAIASREDAEAVASRYGADVSASPGVSHIVVRSCVPPWALVQLQRDEAGRVTEIILDLDEGDVPIPIARLEAAYGAPTADEYACGGPRIVEFEPTGWSDVRLSAWVARANPGPPATRRVCVYRR